MDALKDGFGKPQFLPAWTLIPARILPIFLRFCWVTAGRFSMHVPDCPNVSQIRELACQASAGMPGKISRTPDGATASRRQCSRPSPPFESHLGNRRSFRSPSFQNESSRKVGLAYSFQETLHRSDALVGLGTDPVRHRPWLSVGQAWGKAKTTYQML